MGNSDLNAIDKITLSGNTAESRILGDMTGPVHINYYPVFERGTFEKYPALFNRFIKNSPDHIKRKRRKAWKTLPKYEETVTWPLITGPGFCGATHPGADNVFVETMVGANRFIYDSDCLYVNPSQKVFAISDPPGITTCSRKLFTKLDYYLQNGSPKEMQTIVNNLNHETNLDEDATLSLICFPEKKSGSQAGYALAFVAGDTFLFHGNISQRRLTPIEVSPHFIGTPHIYLEPRYIELVQGDFFIIASDGILSIRGNKVETRLDEVLLEHINTDKENFALNTIMTSNRYSEERIYDRIVPRFGGSDNISILLVYPDELIDTSCQESFILGGYITESQ